MCEPFYDTLLDASLGFILLMTAANSMQKALGALDRPGLAAVLASLRGLRLAGLRSLCSQRHRPLRSLRHRESEIPEPTAPAVDSRPLPPMEILLPEQTTVDEIIVSTV